jgi:hypothetical protein
MTLPRYAAQPAVHRGDAESAEVSPRPLPLGGAQRFKIRGIGIAALLLWTAAVDAATTYRVTITTKDMFHRPPEVQRIIADSENRRLTFEQQYEPFAFDVLLSTDGGKSVTALNTPMRTWFDGAPHPPNPTKRLPGVAGVEIKDAKVTVEEEPTDDTMAGFPTRKFVIRASYKSVENYAGTKMTRIHAITTLLWSTGKLDRSLAFPTPTFATGIASLDAELLQKQELISAFPLRRVTSVSRAYEGGAPSVEITTLEVDDIRTVSSPPSSAFAKPDGYVHQDPIINGANPIINGPGKM